MDPGAIRLGELLQLRDLVQSYCGIRIDENKLVFLKDRLASVIDAHGLTSLGAFCQLLLREIAFGQVKAWNSLLPLVTVNETYFFRERGQLEHFKEPILRQIAARKTDRLIKILSAPCSSGEEPYTLAMLLDETPANLLGWQVDILGIDIDALAIAKARAAVFPLSALRSTDDRYRQRYFVSDEQNFRIIPRIATKVRFENGNLLNDSLWPTLKGLDVIFCRNMLIYFDRPTQKRIVDRLYGALNPGGFLFVGHSESLMTFEAEFVPHITKEAIYYEKPA